MKRPIQIASTLLILSIGLYQPATARAQGSLTPSGPPGPTMKTLTQIKPRTAISAAPFAITVPGSYYLTGNVSVGSGSAITIMTSGVTLDLGGFTISSTSSSPDGYGVLLDNFMTDVTVKNGHIQGGVYDNGSGSFLGGGFQFGIACNDMWPQNVLVSRVSIRGVLYDGIFLGYGTGNVVDSCVVQTAGGRGILAPLIRSCTASDCGMEAIYAIQALDCYGASTLGEGVNANAADNCCGASGSNTGINVATCANNCTGSSTGNGSGVYAGTVNNCYGTATTGVGIFCNNGNNSYGSSQSGYGFFAEGNASGCTGTSQSFYGLLATNAQSCNGASSGTGDGLTAVNTAINCTGTSARANGLVAATVMNCVGSSGQFGNGITGNEVTNSEGSSVSGTGIYALNVAIGCSASSSNSVGLQANIANSCVIISESSIIANKYNMP